MTKRSDELNTEIVEKMNELSELNPEEEYKQEVAAEESDDPEALEIARKKVMLMVNVKCKGISPSIITSQIKPMVYNMNIKDCENMAAMIKKKGMYGLPIMLKKKTKHIG